MGLSKGTVWIGSVNLGLQQTCTFWTAEAAASEESTVSNMPTNEADQSHLTTFQETSFLPACFTETLGQADVVAILTCLESQCACVLKV